MFRSRVFRIGVLAVGLVSLVSLTAISYGSLASAAPPDWQVRTRMHQVNIPKDDRFVPFALTIHTGDSVTWVNHDTDDHTVVSDDAFNTAGHRGLNMLIKGTDSNGGKPGTLTLHFTRPGTFVYYCRFHSHLDSFHQPVAPGPKGGIQDDKGNFGTPMSGVVVVLDDRP